MKTIDLHSNEYVVVVAHDLAGADYADIEARLLAYYATDATIGLRGALYGRRANIIVNDDYDITYWPEAAVKKMQEPEQTPKERRRANLHKLRGGKPWQR